MSALLEVKREYEEAGRRLAEATAEAFPIGSVIAVTLGKSRIFGEVVSAGGCWWRQPSRMSVRNLATGKLRYFSATYEGHAIELISPNSDATQAES